MDSVGKEKEAAALALVFLSKSTQTESASARYKRIIKKMGFISIASLDKPGLKKSLSASDTSSSPASDISSSPASDTSLSPDAKRARLGSFGR